MIQNIQSDSRLVKKNDIFVDFAKINQASINITHALNQGAGLILSDKKDIKKIIYDEIMNFSITNNITQDSQKIKHVKKENINEMLAKIKIVDNIYLEIYKLLDYKMPKFKLLATGTNGKSSCVYYFAQICNELNLNAAYIGTLGVEMFFATSFKQKQNNYSNQHSNYSYNDEQYNNVNKNNNQPINNFINHNNNDKKLFYHNNQNQTQTSNSNAQLNNQANYNLLSNTHLIKWQKKIKKTYLILDNKRQNFDFNIIDNKIILKNNLTTNDILVNHKIFKIIKQHNIENIALEASSHGIHQGRLHGVLAQCLIISSISSDHLDYHKSFTEYVNIKLSLISPNYLQTESLILTTQKVFDNFIKNNKKILSIILENKYLIIILGKDFTYEYEIINYRAKIILSSKYLTKTITLFTSLLTHFQIENFLLSWIAAHYALYYNKVKFHETCMINDNMGPINFNETKVIDSNKIEVIDSDKIEDELDIINIDKVGLDQKKINIINDDYNKVINDDSNSAQSNLYNNDLYKDSNLCKNNLSNNAFNDNLFSKVPRFIDYFILSLTKDYNLQKIQSPKGRMELINYKKGLIVIDYAHNKDSLSLVLQQLRDICKGKLIIVFGCGGERDPYKRPEMGEVAATFCDYIVITDDNPRNEDPKKIRSEIINGVISGIHNNIDKNKIYYQIKNRKIAIKKAINLMQSFDILLISGKGHENVQIIKNKIIKFNDLEITKKIIKENKYIY